MKNIGSIIKNILITIIAAGLIFSARANSFLDVLQQNGIIGNKVSITLLKDIFLWVGIGLSVIFLTIRVIQLESDQKEITQQRDFLLKYNKEMFLRTLSSELGLSCMHINIRIFVCKKGAWLNLLTFLSKCHIIKGPRKEFIIKNIRELSDPGVTQNLSFEVSPDPQGLVGKCYNERQIVYDDNLKETNITDYSLNDYQISKTQNLEFVLCTPIYDRNDNVVSIISFDSTDEIKISEDGEIILGNLIANYCQFLHDYLTFLFE